MGAVLTSFQRNNDTIDSDSYDHEDENILNRNENNIHNQRKTNKRPIDLEETLSLSRKRLRLTSDYIYENLFINGEESDITIHACNRDWKLHKLYLKQSKYFKCMFDGNWKESTSSKVTLEIPDPTITEQALYKTFESFYTDFITIEPELLSGVLATATLLQYESLIHHCESIMKKSICLTNVCEYCKSASTYGVFDVVESCMKWLAINLMSNVTVDLLKNISIDLMSDIVARPDLLVIQVETDVYSMLKKWLFVCMNSLWSGSKEDLQCASDEYFEHLKKGSCHVLEMPQFHPYIKVFERIRWLFVMNDAKSCRLLSWDKIIPSKWLYPLHSYFNSRVIHVDSGLDIGPQEISDEEFSKNCCRCGRILPSIGRFCWRWVGYNYGLDLIMSVHKRTVYIRRNTKNVDIASALCLQQWRYVALKLDIISENLNNTDETVHTTTKKQIFALSKDEDIEIFTIKRCHTFPITIGFNLLPFTPNCKDISLATLHVPRSISSSSVDVASQTGTDLDPDSSRPHSSPVDDSDAVS